MGTNCVRRSVFEGELFLIIVIAMAFSTESDKEKFDLIFCKYKNLMLHKAYEILRDSYLAEDAVSDAFIRIYKNIGKISDPHSKQSIAFVITVVKNTALTLYKKASRARNESVGDEVLENVKDDGFNLEDHVISNITAENMYLLIDRLSEKSKHVFLLKYAYGYSHGEIGKILDMTEGNVTVTLHRAKKTLMGLLSEFNKSNVRISEVES